MNIRTLIRGMVSTSNMPMALARVLSVDMEAMTCDVAMLDQGADVLDVRMTPDPAQAELVVIPAVDSIVIIGFLDSTQAYVAMVSKVDALTAEAGNTVLELTAEGLYIERNGVSLGQTLSDLAAEVKAISDAVSALTVTCAAPGAPSSPPINVASFVTSSAKLSSIQSSINQVLND